MTLAHVLGLWLEESEGAKFWLKLINELKHWLKPKGSGPATLQSEHCRTRSTNSNVALAALEAIRLLPDAANHQEQVKLQGAVSGGSLGSEEPLDPAQLALSRAFWLDAEASRDQIER